MCLRGPLVAVIVTVAFVAVLLNTVSIAEPDPPDVREMLSGFSES
jgi:hypothetical protein